ncbi:MAG: hypothetical protein NZM35_10690 [Chitinophagales bacterium]|nr:hypothetical protein [Chitinophagales bacterium]MDW8419944.1 hypothetical protein [Chitinophagales bacterium]
MKSLSVFTIIGMQLSGLSVYLRGWMRKELLVGVLFCAVWGCVKPPDYPIEPIITFKSLSATKVNSGQVDTIVFTFTDGDGDIGVNPGPGDTCDVCSYKRGDSSCFFMKGYNVFLIDSRDTCVSYYATANIEPKGKFDDLSGEVMVLRTINSQKCFAPPCSIPDTVIYTILMRDKAGHFSNRIKTPPIYIDAP